jgi:DNA repair protein RadC
MINTRASQRLEDGIFRAELLDLVRSTAGCGAWEWNLQLGTLFWSQHTHEIFNVVDFDNTIEGFQKLVHPEDFEPIIAGVSRALATKSTFRSSFRAVLTGGDIRLITTVGKVRYDRSGQATHVIGMFHDITDSEALPKTDSSADSLTSSLSCKHATATASRLTAHRNEFRIYAKNKSAAGRKLMEQSILTFLLMRISDVRSAKQLSKRLLHRFGSVADILSAPYAVLATIDGVKQEHLMLLEICQSSIEAVLEPTNAPLQFHSNSSIITYLRAAQAYQAIEQLRVIYLDRSRQIIVNEIMQHGTVDHTPVYIREIVKRALELSASFLVLVHNHPSGNPEPSQVDVQLTLAVIESAKGLGITVDDHIIIGRQGHVSMKACRLF